MNNARTLILRLRHDSPTREMSMEAADLIEQLSRAQRRLPHSDTITIGDRLPPFDGVDEAQRLAEFQRAFGELA